MSDGWLEQRERSYAWVMKLMVWVEGGLVGSQP